MTTYPVADKLAPNQAIHCASLAVSADWNFANGWPEPARPNPGLRNGTLTFVKTGQRTFGITCQHVVQHYRDVVREHEGRVPYSFRLLQNGFYKLLDRFWQPAPELGQKAIDIALCEVNPALIERLGKEPLDIDQSQRPPQDIKHAIAVGFPENLKYFKQQDAEGELISLPQTTIIAEISRLPDSRFSLFSELADRLKEKDYSGMSGGPIFWSTEDDYGLLGIIYEGGAGGSNSSIYVHGELAIPDVIRSWVSQRPSLG